MNVEEARKLAEPTVKEVVNCIAEKRYTDILKYANFENISLSDFKEEIEGFLELNELPYIDKFDVLCTFQPQYEYHQLSCYIYRDGSGFHMDYDLTTDRELNDLTLQMEFLFMESDVLLAKILDAHVM
ncbi:MAG: hypothetical protein K2N34_12340 [Lachnospiraceae bacterium]|nr:hypothetical protein [Lachnospiraceae bacterium]